MGASGPVGLDMALAGLSLDRLSAIPLHRQIYIHLRTRILCRDLMARVSLPSTRAVAVRLGVSRNTVIAAYDQLQAEGYVLVHQGARAVVADLPLLAPAEDPAEFDVSERGRRLLLQPRRADPAAAPDLRPGNPDVAAFPFQVWRRLLLRGLRPGGEDVFGHHSVAGHAGLRAAIAGYLATARGVRCTPSQVVVTAGAQAALDLLARLLLDPGDTVWMEEPGFPGAQGAFLAAGAALHPLCVDQSGWRLEESAPPPRLVYVTPSCQSPLGVTMRMEQRLRLLDLARRSGSWIVEDDFDSAYRFGDEPVPALYSGDTAGRVVYVGTFGKMLFPSLRIGFMVVPEPLAPRLAQAIGITGQYPPLLLQAALAGFIEQGHFGRHLRRTRRLYARRRTRFLQACTARLGSFLTQVPGNAGIQTTWWLDPRYDDRALVEAARRDSLHLAPLSAHYRHGAQRGGLVLGYATLDDSAMLAGLGRLGRVLDALPERRA